MWCNVRCYAGDGLCLGSGGAQDVSAEHALVPTWLLWRDFQLCGPLGGGGYGGEFCPAVPWRHSVVLAKLNSPFVSLYTMGDRDVGAGPIYEGIPCKMHCYYIDQFGIIAYRPEVYSKGNIQ